MQPEYASPPPRVSPGELPPLKRRRRVITLTSLPLSVLHCILQHYHAPYASTSYRAHAALSGLRLVCRYFSRACDTYVTTFNLSMVPTPEVVRVLVQLPRFVNMTQLHIPPQCTTPQLLGVWSVLIPRLHITSLTFVSETPSYTALFSQLPLQSLSTSSAAFLKALSENHSSISSLDVLMDSMSPQLLIHHPLRVLRLLYRTPPSESDLQSLSAVLHSLPYLHNLSLRVNSLSSSLFPLLSSLPHIHNLALFDACITSPRNINFLCTALRVNPVELNLEWIRNLSDDDVLQLVRAIGPRLSNIRIWNCEALTDQALIHVATYAQNADVELRFIREQFGGRALASLGDRVTWQSSM